MLLILGCFHDYLMIAFHDLNIEKQSGEEMVVRIYFAEMTSPLAQQPSSNPFDLRPPKNQLVYP